MTTDLIEKMAMAMDPLTFGIGTQRATTSKKGNLFRRRFARRRSLVSLSLALEEIGEECAKVADKLGAEWDHQKRGELADAADIVAQAIRARIAEMRAAMGIPIAE